MLDISLLCVGACATDAAPCASSTIQERMAEKHFGKGLTCSEKLSACSHWKGLYGSMNRRIDLPGVASRGRAEYLQLNYAELSFKYFPFPSYFFQNHRAKNGSMQEDDKRLKAGAVVLICTEVSSTALRAPTRVSSAELPSSRAIISPSRLST